MLSRWCIVGSVLIAGSATAQSWQVNPKTDALTGQSYVQYTLGGKFLTPPAKSNGEPPSILLRCDPTGHHMRLSGKYIGGFIVVNAVVELQNGKQNTVQYRLDDGKVKGAEGEVGNSTDYQGLSISSLLLSDLLWGHMIPHKPNSSPQVRKVVIAVQEYLGGQIVMQFDLPDSQEVAAACETEYR